MQNRISSIEQKGIKNQMPFVYGQLEEVIICYIWGLIKFLPINAGN